VEVNGLLWDDANEGHVARHGLTREEVEHVVTGSGFRLDRIDDSHRYGRVVVFGYSASGRCIVVFLDTPTASGLAYVVTARPATNRERQTLEAL
jgi:uncharacterized DUF497 family protein